MARDFLWPMADEIVTTARGAMAALVNPQADPALQTRVPGWLLAVTHADMPDWRRACLHAGLLVLAGDLAEAHAICQAVENPHGAAWHAVVHRREGDFWNSKYWWRRAAEIVWPPSTDIGPGTMAATVTRGGRYDAAAFVDTVEAHRDAQGPIHEELVTIQRWEWLALFAACMAGDGP